MADVNEACMADMGSFHTSFHPPEIILVRKDEIGPLHQRDCHPVEGLPS